MLEPGTRKERERKDREQKDRGRKKSNEEESGQKACKGEELTSTSSAECLLLTSGWCRSQQLQHPAWRNAKPSDDNVGK